MNRLLIALAGLLLASTLKAQVPPEKSAATFAVSDPDLEWSLWASEPLFANPTTIDIDHLGRVWVCEAVNYRCTLHKRPLNRPEGDRILILEDTKGQGWADKVTVFAQAPYIQAPMGIAVAKNPVGPGWKVYVCQSPDILVFEDKDGDGKADGPPKKLLSGFQGIDHDHGVHGITIGPDGKFYFSVGDQGVKDLQSSDGKGRKWTTNKTDCQAGTIWRCDMDGTNLELIAHNFRNPYKPCVDSFGTIFISDNDDDGNQQTRICYVMPGGNYGYWPRGRGESHWHEEQPGVVPKILRTGFGSPTGMCVYEGTLLPKKYWGRVLHTDAGPRQLRAYTMKPQGAGYECLREDMVNSTDTWFRPSDVCVAPDGSVFVADWYDPGVGGHGMGDLTKGRIYRLAPKGNRYKIQDISLGSVEGVSAALGSPSLAVRYMAMSQLRRLPDVTAKLRSGTGREAEAMLRARELWQIAAVVAPNFRSGTDLLPGFEAAGAGENRFQSLHIRALRELLLRYPRIDISGRMAYWMQNRQSEIRREVLLALQDQDPVVARPIILDEARRYEGNDRFYLAAIGIAVGSDPKRRKIILANFEKHFPEWNDKVADLVWELRPPSMMPKLATMLADRKLPEQQRARIVDILATQDAATGRVLLRALNDESSNVVRDRILANLKLFLPGKWRELRSSKDLAVTIDALLAKREAVEGGLMLIAAAEREDMVPRVHQLAVKGSVEAIKTLGTLSNAEAVEALCQLVKSGNDAATRALANHLDNKKLSAPGLAALQGAIFNRETPFTFRAVALESLASSRAGTQWLLSSKERLPPDLLADAGRLLRNSPHEDLRTRALRAFPPPARLDMKNLPTLTALAAKRGDAERGKRLLAASANTDAACIKCHTVNGAGGAIGPDLSAIGTKASRENLFESLLYPSKAIADQFVNWQVTLKKGVTLGGLLVEENAESIVIRDANGKDTRIAKSEIESREKSLHSLMPEDNAKTLTEEELVDLVEYLMTLKGPMKPAN